MNVPAISKLQWHPFTINSDSNLEAEIVSVIIKGEGNWTKKLYQMLSSPSPLHHLDVSIEGPYGPFSTHFLRHDALVMVSGGSGVTPFISIIRHLIFLSQTRSATTPPPPPAFLICAFKNSSDLSVLDLLLPISSPFSPHYLPDLNLQIEAFVTREPEPTITENRHDHLHLKTQTLWFNPNASASRLSPVLGPNSWLWLGAIVSSSFVMFLILIGLLTRYYIFPIDHNTNQIYSYSARAAINGLIICACIAGAASAAFYWNKKGRGRETKQVQNLEGASPEAAAAESRGVIAERELESLPQPSLAHCTNVHYGVRPDLKRMLFERKEPSTGVLVCGPKKLSYEVARICSSGLAHNLHFESISFSW
ncbi:ferric-chelate reductase (NADH) [Sarracenia purpurea var. burkii]